MRGGACAHAPGLVPPTGALAHSHSRPRAASTESLAARGIVLYPGKTTKAESFRIGSIGRIYEADMRLAVAALKEVLLAQGVALPVKQKGA